MSLSLYTYIYIYMYIIINIYIWVYTYIYIYIYISCAPCTVTGSLGRPEDRANSRTAGCSSEWYLWLPVKVFPGFPYHLPQTMDLRLYFLGDGVSLSTQEIHPIMLPTFSDESWLWGMAALLWKPRLSRPGSRWLGDNWRSVRPFLHSTTHKLRSFGSNSLGSCPKHDFS